LVGTGRVLAGRLKVTLFVRKKQSFASIPQGVGAGCLTS
jgi:hypothetical protein